MSDDNGYANQEHREQDEMAADKARNVGKAQDMNSQEGKVSAASISKSINSKLNQTNTRQKNQKMQGTVDEIQKKNELNEASNEVANN